jgi:adrenodoxin-NADP+ reductase
VGGNELEARPGSCQITLATVLRHYDIITFAYGASEDRTLGVPGESLEGVYSAREFVGWYNGLPSKSGFTPDLTAGEEAVIIGQGNVAIDVARMLLKSPSELQSTDISEEAIESLSRSRVKRIKIVGRRGPMQVSCPTATVYSWISSKYSDNVTPKAKFTRAEIRGLLNIPGVALHPIDDTVVPPGFQGEELQNGRGKARRLFQTLLNGSRTVSSEEATKTWSLEFCLAPHRFLSNASNPSAVKCTMFRRTQLSSPTNLEAHVIYTEEFETFNSSLVFRSIGYKSVPLEGFNEAGIAFDAGRGVIKTDGKGRVLNLDNSAPIPGLYCSGWLNTGATGVIGDTMAHSHQTATAISRDVRVGADLCRIGRGPDDSAAGWEGVKAETPRSRLSRAVTWQDWKKINEAELKNGKAVGKKRLKFTTTSGMLAVLD